MHSQFLLVCEAQSTNLEDGRWHFALETADGTLVLQAGDEEHGDLNRLTLLAAVRGLEAIEGPACVTLVSNNRYLIRSLTDSLPRWRGNDFVWEHFGRRIEIQHADLWRRIDRCVTIHRVEACLMTSRVINVGGVTDEPAQDWRVDSAPREMALPTATSTTHLRSWLMGGGAASGVLARRRFTTADLLEVS